MIPCVRFKSGVRVDPMTPALARIICNLDMAARIVGVELTVTCGRESHGAGDPHTLGKALDVRAADLTPEKIIQNYHYLQSVLGELFTVLYEVPTAPVNGALNNIAYVNADATAPHFHIQLKKGVEYPPVSQGLSA